MNLSGDQIKNSYGGLLNIGASGADGTLQPVTDGFGNVLPFEVSTTTINFTGAVTGGPVGPTGAAGSSGTSGVSGSSGTSGVNGSSGTSGTDGTSGTSGTSGANGSSGTSGTDGTSGTSGANGSSGTSGTDGTSGTSGTSGANGSSGTSGTDGTSGTSGVSGSTGSSGSSGTSGTSGVSGSSGTSGTDGTSGVNGANGSSGTSGVSGSSGTSGTSGTSGVSGSSGSSGTSGTDGTSGTSGINGATGPAGPGASSPITVETTDNLVSTAIGATSGNSNYTVALGFNAQTCSIYGTNQGDGNIAIGCCARARGIKTIQIGNTNNESVYGIGIGHDLNAVAGDSTIVGYGGGGDGYGRHTGLGSGARPCGDASIAVGYCAVTQGFHSTTIGSRSSSTNCTSCYSNILGACSCSNNSACSNIIGSFNTIFSGATGTTVIGQCSVGGTGACNSIVIGNSARSEASCSVVIGYNVSTSSPNAILIGGNANTITSPNPYNTIINGESNCIENSGWSFIASSCSSKSSFGLNNTVIGSIFGNASGDTTTGIYSAYDSCITGASYRSVVLASYQGFMNSSTGAFIIGSYGCADNAGYGGILGGNVNTMCSSSVSVIIGGVSNSILATSDCSAIIGGCGNTMSGKTNTVIIGGLGITADRSDTTYVQSLVAYGQGASLVNDIGNVTGTATVNWNDSNNQSLTLLGSTTLTFSNPIAGANYMIEVTQGGVGSYTITWPTIKWAFNNPPVLTTGVGGIDVINLFYDGTNYLGTFALNFV